MLRVQRSALSALKLIIARHAHSPLNRTFMRYKHMVNSRYVNFQRLEMLLCVSSPHLLPSPYAWHFGTSRQFPGHGEVPVNIQHTKHCLINTTMVLEQQAQFILLIHQWLTGDKYVMQSVQESDKTRVGRFAVIARNSVSLQHCIIAQNN